jgi:protein-disulfide isomerase
MAVAAAGLLIAGCGGGSSPASAAGGDMVLGSADARVTVIEYASLTCAACAAFHTRDFPRLKADYIDTGKVRYILREFPNAGYSPPVATAQFMLARCMSRDADSYYRIISSMFAQFQATGQASEQGQAQAHLQQMAQTGGMSADQFQACIRNQAERDRIAAVEKKGVEDFRVERTPTFIIDGQVVTPNTFDGLKPLIDAKLAN